MNIAFTLSYYDEAVELDPSIAEWKTILRSWVGNSETDTSVKTHTCSESELGLVGNDSKFMSIKESSQIYVESRKDHWICFDQRDLSLRGDFNSNKAQALLVTLHRC